VLTDQQKAFRRTGITAGDVRALCGVDPYGRTEHDVWRAKVLGDDDIEESEAMSLGNELEPVVIRRLAEKVGRRIIPTAHGSLTRRHRAIAHHIATPDVFLSAGPVGSCNVDLANGDLSLGEVKVVGIYAAGEWGPTIDGAVPDWVQVQCAWQMHVTEIPVCHVGALIGTEVRTYKLERDDDLEGTLIDVVDRFHKDHIVACVAPAIDGSENSRRMLRARWPRQLEGSSRKADEFCEHYAREYFAAKKIIKEQEARAELAAQHLIERMGHTEHLKGDGWRVFYKHRDACAIPAATRGAYRHFDIRAVKGKEK
jgi:predicted phage-related endonuclease